MSPDVDPVSKRSANRSSVVLALQTRSAVRRARLDASRNAPMAATEAPRIASSNTMIRNGDLLRFTSDEIDEFRSAGLDVAHVRTIEDFGAAVATWCDVLDKARPDLLE